MPFQNNEYSAQTSTLNDHYTMEESRLIPSLIDRARLTEIDRSDIEHRAISFVDILREDNQRLPMVDAFLQQFGLSTEEGIILMRLAESLIRTPDFDTAAYLIRDKLSAGNWRIHAGQSDSIMVNAGTRGLQITRAWARMSGGPDADNLWARMGDRVIHAAIKQAFRILGRHFVLGDTIENARTRARAMPSKGVTYSYDMLGEAALTMVGANRYFEAYRHAITTLAAHARQGQSIQQSAGLSVKLSALHPRYEYLSRTVCVPLIVDRLKELCGIAKSAGLSLTIDAEEADRLEVSQIVFEHLLACPDLDGWNGLGMAIQAYQRRALPVIDWLQHTAAAYGRRVTCRLVKGAYWDSEIKRAQELGLESYPVFTRKENTDLSYLACARALLDAGEVIYPQFATHNAHSAAAIMHMAGNRRDFEFQRLHGMSDTLHNLLTEKYGVSSRVYAPVGKHKDLLPYLVRRLLENGANSSFVNQLLDPDISAATLSRDPVHRVLSHTDAQHPAIPAPRDVFSGQRLAAEGLDITQSQVADALEHLPALPFLEVSGLSNGKASQGDIVSVLNPSDSTQTLGKAQLSTPSDLEQAIRAAKTSDWRTSSPEFRAQCLKAAADALEADMPSFMKLCVMEAGKTWDDAVAEIREAVDFLRYYAIEATGVSVAHAQPLGLVACISPWNFPLAIFIGQVSAALSAGNTVIAKPAEQTPLVAFEATKLMHKAGIPEDALHLILGDGRIGAAMTQSADVDGICFTGSTDTAKKIAAAMAATDRADIPYIAETGGINAMIIDSTALLEQSVKDAVDSAFRSAGQRCSACRIVCVQEDIIEPFNQMLSGSMALLRIGDPSDLQTDVGPVIDQEAKDRIVQHIAAMKEHFHTITTNDDMMAHDGYFVPPVAISLDDISDLKEEIFGPVLHVVTYKADAFDELIDKINALGFGLTLGLHTRIDDRINAVSRDANVGNVYVNRNQIGAVVGVQPFGGHGLSGTGPKAGGPNYVARLTQPSKDEHAVTAPASVTLPGPTGEENTLSYEPRGHLLCLGGDQATDLPAQIQRAEATGNTIFSCANPTDDDLLKWLETDIDGVVADGAVRARVARLIAVRAGAILPLLSAYDDVKRFCVEKTVTINTTAAGGNASLLAGM